MRLGIVSDLHLEASHMDVPCEGLDVLVIAGDTHTDIEYVRNFTQCLLYKYRNLEIVIVPGNHECYGKAITQTELLMATLKASRCHVLLNDSVRVQGVVFVGGTLWARIPKGMCAAVEATVKDFERISELSTERMKRECNDCCDAIFTEAEQCYLTEKTPLVVVTHFAPSLHSLHPKYGTADMPFNRYFCNELESVVIASNATLWIHGHTHSSMDYILSDTRVICNPRGWSADANAHPENPQFECPKIVDLPTF